MTLSFLAELRMKLRSLTSLPDTGMLVSFLLINVIQFAGVATSILYLFCLIWKILDLKCGAWLICVELG